MRSPAPHCRVRTIKFKVAIPGKSLWKWFPNPTTGVWEDNLFYRYSYTGWGRP
jgi:hypothetical protein